MVWIFQYCTAADGTTYSGFVSRDFLLFYALQECIETLFPRAARPVHPLLCQQYLVCCFFFFFFAGWSAFCGRRGNTGALLKSFLRRFVRLHGMIFSGKAEVKQVVGYRVYLFCGGTPLLLPLPLPLLCWMVPRTYYCKPPCLICGFFLLIRTCCCWW